MEPHPISISKVALNRTERDTRFIRGRVEANPQIQGAAVDTASLTMVVNLISRIEVVVTSEAEEEVEVMKCHQTQLSSFLLSTMEVSSQSLEEVEQPQFSYLHPSIIKMAIHKA